MPDRLPGRAHLDQLLPGDDTVLTFRQLCNLQIQMHLSLVVAAVWCCSTPRMTATFRVWRAACDRGVQLCAGGVKEVRPACNQC